MKKFNKKFYIYFIALMFVIYTPQISSALVFPFNISMSGLNENPPNASPAFGNITGSFDNVTKVMSFNITFSGLLGPTTASHFHAAAGLTTNAPVRIANAGFPVGVTFGAYGNSYVLTAQQEGWLMTDSMYLNIHTNVFPGGELRCQMTVDAPLPVELSSFTSLINANEVTLNWTTSSELNNSGFEIERASGKNEWTKIGFVSGNGNIASPVNYSFTDNGLNVGMYNYRLKQIDFNGNFEYFNLSNEVNIGVPAEFDLSQNYPNPFNPSTKINFNLPADGKVSLKVFDMSGKEIMTLVNEVKTAGYYTVNFNSSSLSSGVYFYTVQSNNFTATKKMLLLK